MKVVISGGAKTANIVTGIQRKFDSGGVDFTVVPFIENIDDIYQRGEWFDKAIIIEQSWNRDFEDMNEVAIRHKVNAFANSSAVRAPGASFVFLTQNEETASIIYDEIIAIQSSSVVIVKQPKYSVSFFNSLVTTEFDRLPEELIYKPVLNTEVNTQNNLPDDTGFSGFVYDTQIQDDLTHDIFGDNDGGFNDAGRMDINEGEGWDIPEDTGFEPDVDFDDTGFDVPNNPNQDEQFRGFGEPEPEYNPQQSGDLGDMNWDTGFGDEPNWDTNPGTEFGGAEQGWEQPQQDWEKPQQNWEEPIENNQHSGEIPDYSGNNNTFIPVVAPVPQPEPEPEPDYNNQQYEQQYEPPIQDQQPYDGFGDDNMYNEGYNPDLDNYNPNSGYNNDHNYNHGFDDRDYDGEPDVVAPNTKQYNKVNLTNAQIKATLDAFANRGNSILVTGCGGCGTSTVALNLANIINNLGYTVLLVDLDTENKAQSYISKDNYESMEPESASLMAAINSTSGINAHIAIVRQGFHLLTMGMASDSIKIEKAIHKDKISRFINLAKTSHNFIIYDVPFETAIGFGKDFTFMADNIVMTIDCSNWGITKTMLNVCNIDSDDMMETFFNRGQILFNRYRALNKVMGRKVKTAIDITKVMDFKVRDLLGEDPGYYFQTMHICGLINEDARFESGWYGDTQYSDTKDGSKVFLDVLKNIVLKQ